jgi:Putative Actinobacterial Holin-X, holin superfamily III
VARVRTGGVSSKAREVAEHAGALKRLQLELAALELKRKAASFGIGAGLACAAALLAFFALAFALASATAGIATALPVWAALLIMTGALVLLVVILALVAKTALQRGTPPVPEAAIREAKLTANALRR